MLQEVALGNLSLLTEVDSFSSAAQSCNHEAAAVIMELWQQ